jgi:hypothetical protein
MKKVIRLTESDLEKIVRRVLSEQRIEDRGKPTAGAKATFKLENTFESGEYKLNNSAELSKVETAIESFLKKYPKSKITSTIKAGESKVPNPKGFEKEGSLAQARANEVEKYFGSKFPKLRFGDTDVVIGTTDWDENKGKNHPEYKREQFFIITVDASGEPIQPNVRIVPNPTYAMDASGIVRFVGFTDGTMFIFNRNDSTQEQFLEQFNKSPEFNSFRDNRIKLTQTCNRYQTMCEPVTYDKTKYIPVNSQNVFNQLMDKVKSEELVFPTGVQGQSL